MSDYRPFFAKLKGIDYDRRISIERRWTDMRTELGPSLATERGVQSPGAARQARLPAAKA